MAESEAAPPQAPRDQRDLGLRDAAARDATRRDETHRDVGMQRVRVGLTGLATVFLLTLLAASIFNLLGQDDPKGLKLSNGAVITNIAEPAEPPKEPLAELGVAPGAAPLKPAVIPIPSGLTVPPPDANAQVAQQGSRMVPQQPAPLSQPQTARQQPAQPATR